ncbi:hypothetical protein [Streptomyces lavendofoliae]|uniref:hypothetical protein n=1 Tax=Streptomyces lavendofoliae TaxID=67314 RepID=UPI003D8C958B
MSDIVSGIGVRSTGFALAIGESRHADTWIASAQVMESHFSLARDFPNSITLESFRRKIVTLYIEFTITSGLFPLIPLNRHPEGGFVLFCPASKYDDVVADMTQGRGITEGIEARRRIMRFTELGGDLSYV